MKKSLINIKSKKLFISIVKLIGPGCMSLYDKC